MAAAAGNASWMQSLRPTAARMAWIDVARGIGIILVVYAHTFGGMIAAGMPGGAYDLQNRLIYGFHMAVFFFLSGLFARSAAARGIGPFLRGRALTIVYPYLLWSFITVLLGMVAAGAANHAASLGQLATILWVPPAQFWFLYALLICQLLLLLPGRYTLAAIVPLGVLAVATFGIEPKQMRTLANLPYFAAGVYLGGARAADLLESRRRAGLLAVAGWAAFGVLFLMPSPAGPVAWWSMKIAIAFAGVAGTLGLSRLITDRAWPLALLGAASMPIFVMHTVVAAVVRVAGLKLGAGWPLLVILATIAGIAVPFVADIMARRLGIEAWVGFGRGNRKPRPLEGSVAKGDVAVSQLQGAAVP